MAKHKVFISYHHDGDQYEKERFVQRFGHVFADRSVRLGDIPDGLQTETIRQKIRDKWLRDSTVTIVLIGQKTWARKHVDWEIGSSLRSTVYNSRSGLLGILLPSYSSPNYPYNRFTIPPRLADNLDGPHPFATVRDYPTQDWQLERWVEEAFQRRKQEPPPNNSRLSFVNNRSGQRWSD